MDKAHLKGFNLRIHIEFIIESNIVRKEFNHSK